MKNLISKLLMLTFAMFINAMAFAQEDKPDMADLMRSNGKIYVVVAVILTILIGLFIYVFMLDRKIGRMEKNQD